MQDEPFCTLIGRMEELTLENKELKKKVRRHHEELRELREDMVLDAEKLAKRVVRKEIKKHLSR